MRMQKKNNQLEVGMLRWKCRRGLLELDVLLNRFFEKHFHLLSTHQREIFSQMLDETDAQLLPWLMGYEQPTEPEFKQLVTFISSLLQPKS